MEKFKCAPHTHTHLQLYNFRDLPLGHSIPRSAVPLAQSDGNVNWPLKLFIYTN